MVKTQERAPDADVLKYRRRMRGLSTFFILVSCLAMVGVAILASAGGSDQHPIEDLWGRGFYIFVTLLTALMAWNGSRLGAVLLLVVILSGFIDLTSEKDAAVLAGLARTIVYSGLAVALIWNTNRYHQECAIADAPIGGSGFIRWGGLVISVITLAVIGLSVAVLSSNISTAVVAGSDINEEHVAWLKEQEYLLPDETSLFFYSEGLFSISEGGSLLTDQYVGGWWQEDGEVLSQWFRLGEVCRIQTVDSGNFFTDATYKIHGPGTDNWLILLLSVEDNGDDRFIRRLSLINKENKHAAVDAACKSGEDIDQDALALENGIEAAIVSANQIKPDQIEWLEEKEFLTSDETPLKFYSHGVYHIKEGGSLLTDAYFGGWYNQDGDLGSSWAKLGEICTFNLVEPNQEDPNADSVYKITFSEDSWYSFLLPKKEGGDVAFIDQVKSLNSAARTPKSIDTCKAHAELLRTQTNN